MNRYFICSVLALALPAATWAQETRALSLREAVRLGLERNPDILLASLEHEKARQAAEVAASGYSPYAQVGSGLGWTAGIPQSIEGSTPSVVRASARKTLYDKQLGARIREAEAMGEAAGHSAAAKQDEVAYRVAAAWLELERGQRAADVLRERVERLRAVERAAEARLNEGRVLPLDLSRARLETARAEQEAAAAESDRRLGEAVLRSALDLGPSIRLTTAPGEPLPELAAPVDAEEGAARAVAASEELRSLEAAARAKGYSVEAEKGGRYPRLDLVAQYSLLARFNNFEQFFNRFQRHNGQVGMSLSVPVFTGKAVSSRVAQAGIEERAAALRLAARRADVELESHRLYGAVERALAAQRMGRLELDFARENLSVVLARYEEGRAALDDVESARAEESAAWQRYYDAQYEAQRARLDLLRRTGDLASALR